MAATSFRLETLLKMRLVERQRRRAEVAEAHRAETVLNDRLAQLDLQHETVKKQLRVGSEPGVVQVDRLLEVHRYELVLAARKELIRQQQAKLAEEIDRRRRALIEAEREVRVLEKLRERQQERERRQAGKREQRILDEIAQRGPRGTRT